MRRSNEHAVSPVVGVMLMLVVVIIIAAIVSGFAGSMIQTNNKAPQATIKGTLYVNGSSNLVILTHAGGDTLVPSKIQVVLHKGDEWGSYAGILDGGIKVIQNSDIRDSSNNYWVNATTGAAGKNTFAWRPGESVYVTYSGATSNDVGRSIDIEISTIDGKLISKSKMPVVP